MGILTFCAENGSTMPSLSYKIMLEYLEKKSIEFLMGTTHDPLWCMLETKM